MSKELQLKAWRLVVLLGVMVFLAGCGIPDLPGPLGIPGV